MKQKKNTPDYKGFMEHYDALCKFSVCMEDLFRLAKIYHTPVPKEYKNYSYYSLYFGK